MRKICLFMLLLLIVMPHAICDEDIQIEIHEQTTDETIQFLGLPWGCDYDTAYETISSLFPDANTLTVNKIPSEDGENNQAETTSFSDRSQKFFKRLSSNRVMSTELLLQKMKEDGPFAGYKFVIGEVAGHPVVTARMCFIDNDDFGLYEAGYVFNTDADKDIPNDKRYEDIKNKLSAKYGNPYEYHVHVESTKFLPGHDGECSVWIGESGSAAYLYYDVEFGGYYPGSGSLYLYYGTTSCNDLFVKYSGIEEQTEEDRIERKLDLIAGNDSGL